MKKRFTSILSLSLAICMLTACEAGAQTEPTSSETATTIAVTETTQINESNLLSLPDPSPEFVPLSDALQCTMSEEALSVAASMPPLSTQCANWRGTSMAFDTISWHTDHRLYRQEDCNEIADMGFNYVRFQVNSYDLLDNAGKIDHTILDNLDEVIGWCSERGIHVNLDLHTLPGYGTGLSDDELDILSNTEHRELAIALWDTIAERYQNVSANALSYNLVNEPTTFYFTKENYAELAGELIDTIRKYDDDKMIVSDGMLSSLDSGNPAAWDNACPSIMDDLLDNSITQTIHIYPYHSGAPESGYINMELWPYEHMPAVSGSIYGDFCIDITGDFKSGSLFEFNLADISSTDEPFTFSYNGITEEVLPNEINGTQRLSVTLTESTDKISLGIKENSSLCATILEVFVRIPTDTESTYLIPDHEQRSKFSYETGKYETRYYQFLWVMPEGRNVLHLENKLPTADFDVPGADSFDMETLRNYLALWKSWSDETGTFIMVNEMGIPIGLPEEARERYLTTLWNLLDENEIPWCIYTNQYENWGPVVDVKASDWYTVPADGSLTRKGENYYDEMMLELIAQRAKK